MSWGSTRRPGHHRRKDERDWAEYSEHPRRPRLRDAIDRQPSMLSARPTRQPLQRPMIRTLRSVARFRPFERDRTAARLARAACVADLRAVARGHLPRGVFDYIEGGAEDERTLASNTQAFARTVFRPRVLRDVEVVEPSTVLLGRELPLPLVLAPTGFTRVANPAGELAVARAAGRVGVPYTLATLSTRSIEEVAEAGEGPLWFQLYVWRDRGLVNEMIQRATDAGYEALVLTVDTAVFGRRERDVRRGFALPPRIGFDTLVDGAMHPAWTWRFIRSDPIRFSNVVGRGVADGSSAVRLADYINAQFDPSLSWGDVDWIRSVWRGPIVLKGIQTVEDARLASDAGMDAIALSNHGGRQLDSAPAALDLVRPVADAVGDRVEIICDGGVRRGSDIVKAVALGARACMAGRAYLYGLAAAGERGVDHVLGLLDADVRRTMALLGTRTIDELSPDVIADSSEHDRHSVLPTGP
jgi:L-lactate dehydrogenase (cytochrome)